MLTITFIRHAPTTHNQQGIFMGVEDIELSKEAINSIGSFPRQDFDLILSSPLKRAKKSAEALFPAKPIKEEERLKEKNLGIFGGKSKQEIRNVYPEAFLLNGTLNPKFTPQAGETFEEMVGRLNSFLKCIETTYFKSSQNSFNVVAVTHNGVIRTVRWIIEKTGIEKIFMESERFLAPVIFEYSEGSWHKT